MPAPQSGSPMTHMLTGRQYLVIAISGGRRAARASAAILIAASTREESMNWSTDQLVKEV